MKLLSEIKSLLEARRDRSDSRRSRADRRASISKMDDLKMDDKVYKLRRQVIDIIYLAKTVDRGLPRIRVRIGKNTASAKDKGILAVALVSKDSLWVDQETLDKSKWTEDDLIRVVLHEIIHASYGVRHVPDKNDIMYPIHQSKTQSESLKNFELWFKRYTKGQIAEDGYTDEKGNFIPWYVKG